MGSLITVLLIGPRLRLQHRQLQVPSSKKILVEAGERVLAATLSLLLVALGVLLFYLYCLPLGRVAHLLFSLDIATTEGASSLRSLQGWNLGPVLLGILSMSSRPRIPLCALLLKLARESQEYLTAITHSH
jgi:hypothetical protein